MSPAALSTTIAPAQTHILQSLKVQSTELDQPNKTEEPYQYAHLLPHFSDDCYPPLVPFDHIDPAFRALTHSNPRSFLDNASSVVRITPHLGTEIRGVQLTSLNGDARDQLALLVRFRI